MINKFPMHDLRQILRLLDEAEKAYREQANNSDDIQRLYQLSSRTGRTCSSRSHAAARGMASAKTKIKEYMKSKYNICKL